MVLYLYDSDELPEDITPFVEAIRGRNVDQNEKTTTGSPVADEPENENSESEAQQEAPSEPEGAAVPPQTESPSTAPQESAADAEPETAAPHVSPAADEDPEEKPKRNCGRTGPTSAAGKSKIALNSLQHGCCAKTLILPGEKEERWLALLADWESAYPGDHPLLQEFITRTAQAEWQRIRAQFWHDNILWRTTGEPYHMDKEELAHYERQLRYLTTAERRFQREYKMLEYFYDKNYKREKAGPAPAPAKEPDPPQPAPEPEEPEEEQEETLEQKLEAARRVKFYNVETGEYYMDGKYYPGPPDWVPEKITPGVYPPNHIASWRYKGDPKDRFKKKKKKR